MLKWFKFLNPMPDMQFDYAPPDFFQYRRATKDIIAMRAAWLRLLLWIVARSLPANDRDAAELRIAINDFRHG